MITAVVFKTFQFECFGLSVKFYIDVNCFDYYYVGAVRTCHCLLNNDSGEFLF